jgi:hypothetical protein
MLWLRVRNYFVLQNISHYVRGVYTDVVITGFVCTLLEMVYLYSIQLFIKPQCMEIIKDFFLCMARQPYMGLGLLVSSRFHGHTHLRHTTVGRTPLDE